MLAIISPRSITVYPYTLVMRPDDTTRKKTSYHHWTPQSPRIILVAGKRSHSCRARNFETSLRKQISHSSRLTPAARAVIPYLLPKVTSLSPRRTIKYITLKSSFHRSPLHGQLSAVNFALARKRIKKKLPLRFINLKLAPLIRTYHF